MTTEWDSEWALATMPSELTPVPRMMLEMGLDGPTASETLLQALTGINIT
jgi:hypothetical protein